MLVAQPVSSRPVTVFSSTCFQFFPWSALRHRPSPTTLIVTSPFVRFTTTPEQPPGHSVFAPSLVSRSSNGLEMSVHSSAAWRDALNIAATAQVMSRRQRRSAGSGVEKIAFIVDASDAQENTALKSTNAD